MLKNYFIVAVRNMVRHAVFSSVTIFGFATGMTCVLLILLYVWDELNYDKHHQHSGRIYRVVQEQYFAGSSQLLATTSGPVAVAIKNDFPEIERVSRILIRKNTLLAYKENRFYGEDIAFADADVFNVFTLPLLKGNAVNALKEPNTMVLTQETAQKYFGEEEPIGKILKLNNKPYTVTAVLKNLPASSHFHFSSLASISTYEQSPWMQNWGITSLWTYVLVKPQANLPALYKKLPAFVEKYHGEGYAKRISYHLQPLTDIHLYSDMAVEIEPNGNILFVRVFAAIAIFILLLACINYINLSTARAAERMKEIGMRKIVGAQRIQVVLQFLTESLFTSLLAFMAAIIIVMICLPAFSQLAGKNFTWATIDKNIVMVSLLVFIFAGLLSGLYPAWFLSGFRPMNALKGNLHRIQTGFNFRKVLVVLQFTVSIILIATTLISYQQLTFISQTKLGFDKEQIINIKVRDTSWRSKIGLLQNELAVVPGVVKTTASLNFMGEELDGSDVRLAGAPESENRLLAVTFVDYNFIETLHMQMAAGRSFSRQFATDTSAAFIINEAAVKAFGWTSAEEAIGKELEYLGGGRSIEPVIGVVKDFHFASLHQQVQPLLLICWPSRLSSVSIKLAASNPAKTLAQLEKKWQSLLPDFPFEYQFADVSLDKLYKSDQRAGQLFTWFAILAIGIACLGLYGMVAFTTARRTKEIGIRKVLGASVPAITWLVSRDFLFLILISVLIATPMAWYVASQWLSTFAYHIPLTPIPFILAGLLACLIALLTISYQSIKSALANPVKSLRNE